jgi:homospermidine synthase
MLSENPELKLEVQKSVSDTIAGITHAATLLLDETTDNIISIVELNDADRTDAMLTPLKKLVTGLAFFKNLKLRMTTSELLRLCRKFKFCSAKKDTKLFKIGDV